MTKESLLGGSQSLFAMTCKLNHSYRKPDNIASRSGGLAEKTGPHVELQKLKQILHLVKIETERGPGS